MAGLFLALSTIISFPAFFDASLLHSLAALPNRPIADDGGGQQGEYRQQAKVVRGASTLSELPASVVEGNQNPEPNAEREQQNARNLASFTLKHNSQQFEHFEGAHEVPLGMNAHR